MFKIGVVLLAAVPTILMVWFAALVLASLQQVGS